jgi:hypothetical protein
MNMHLSAKEKVILKCENRMLHNSFHDSLHMGQMEKKRFGDNRSKKSHAYGGKLDKDGF